MKRVVWIVAILAIVAGAGYGAMRFLFPDTAAVIRINRGHHLPGNAPFRDGQHDRCKNDDDVKENARR